MHGNEDCKNPYCSQIPGYKKKDLWALEEASLCTQHGISRLVLGFLVVVGLFCGGLLLLLFFSPSPYLLVQTIWVKRQKRELPGWKTVFLSLWTALNMSAMTIQVFLFLKLMLHPCRRQNTTKKSTYQWQTGRMACLNQTTYPPIMKNIFVCFFLIFAWQMLPLWA